MISDAREREADHREVGDDDRADEDLEDQEELALLNQVGLARLVDQLGDVGHRAMHRQLLTPAYVHAPNSRPRTQTTSPDIRI